MLSFLPAPVIGVLAFLLLVVNTLIWTALLFVFTLIKLLLPFTATRRYLDPILTGIATLWITGNTGWMRLTQKTRWTVTGGENLSRKHWYLVMANHQSWVDIFVLQRVLNRKVPMLKFFLKKELAKIPVMGQAWWALDFPFMSRHSRAFLKEHPEQADKDLRATQKACRRFSLIPTSVMNFVEGTRYSDSKAKRQGSPYRYLLKPKAGGLAFAVQVLGDKFSTAINVTLIYPDSTPTFWSFLCGQVDEIVVQVKTTPIPAEFSGKDYSTDNAHRINFQRWLSGIWAEKDHEIHRYRESHQLPTHAFPAASTNEALPPKTEG
jgi:1-acyl-sn-glycerol-3-phosphate acyltransferase